MTPAEKTKAVREKYGLNQSQLGELLGVHFVTVSKWERGKSSPSAYQSNMLSNFLESEARDVKNSIVQRGAIFTVRQLLGA